MNVPSPDVLVGDKTYWLAAPDDPAARALRWVAREVIQMVEVHRRERERHLAAIGRSVYLPKEDPAGQARERALLDVLELLRDVDVRLREEE